MLKTLAQKYSNIMWAEFNSRWLHEGEIRLDGSFYCGDAVQSYLILEKWKDNVNTIGDYSEKIFYPGRFKRIWVDKNHGEPFYTGTQILADYPQTDKYIAPKITPNLESYRVEENQILVTRSGTIGNIILVGKKLSNSLVTEDAIRIITKHSALFGFIYAFLKSEIGNPLIQQSIFGAVIDHIEPNHIEQIKIPVLNKSEIKKIHDDIINVYNLRNKANDLICESESLFYEILNLPRINDNKTHYYKNTEIKAWENYSWSERFRLDSSFYNPLAKVAIRNINNAGHQIKKLGEENNIYELPTYKRIYLKKDHGIPFLSGKNLTESIFSDLKYLSKKPFKNINNYLIYNGMILISMRGTCGKVRLIDSSLNGYGASHNIIRLMPSPNYNAGYLYIYLISDYGRQQMNSKILGSVVDVLTPEDCGDIYFPVISNEIQKQIGERAERAFEFRAEANRIENKTIKYLEKILKDL